ncbi:hypothetical protein BZG36_04892 [Bifiguratus adelaidae]|uniref:Arrestin C-terminal-like domain-containing protein n=1 Tax=Bifiguratus adelaidae TaxID=1938954 RepID=A0A261XUD9_9FUNG|nr:hypothetical protein BZG36_04892 [Bifiguratus adelaidae]
MLGRLNELSIDLDCDTVFMHYGLHASSVLRGSVVLRLKAPVLVESFVLKIVGMVQTKWPEVLGLRKRSTSDVWLCIDQTIPLYPFTTSTESRRKLSLLPPKAHTADGSILLNDDFHSFDFELTLPDNLPETIECDVASVIYTLSTFIRYRSPSWSLCHTSRTGRQIILTKLPPPCFLQQDGRSEGIVFSRRLPDLCEYTFWIDQNVLTKGAPVTIYAKIVSEHKYMTIEFIRSSISEKRVFRRADAEGSVRIDARRYRLAQLNRKSGRLDYTLDTMHSILPVYEDTLTFHPSKTFNADGLHHSTLFSHIRIQHWINISFCISYPHPDNNGKQVRKNIRLTAPIHIVANNGVNDFLTLPSYSSSETSLTPASAHSNASYNSLASSRDSRYSLASISGLSQMSRRQSATAKIKQLTTGWIRRKYSATLDVSELPSYEDVCQETTITS